MASVTATKNATASDTSAKLTTVRISTEKVTKAPKVPKTKEPKVPKTKEPKVPKTTTKTTPKPKHTDDLDDWMLGLDDEVDEDWKQFMEIHGNQNQASGGFDHGNGGGLDELGQELDCIDRIENDKLRNAKLKSTDEVEAGIRPLNISTRTKIYYLNVTNIPVFDIFWKLKLLPYTTPQSGVIRKQIVAKHTSRAEVDAYVERREQIPYFCLERIVKQITNTNTNARKNVFTDERILTVGVAKKNIMNCHCKDKRAFINCAALTYRIYNRTLAKFCELHFKLFYTGRVTVPGIVDADDEVISEFKQHILELLAPFVADQLNGAALAFIPTNQLPKEAKVINVKRTAKLAWDEKQSKCDGLGSAMITTSAEMSPNNGTANLNKDTTTITANPNKDTTAITTTTTRNRNSKRTKIIEYRTIREDILINSDFNCGFHINQSAFLPILINKYGLSASYNKSSYPGIKCRIFVNNTLPLTAEAQTGIADPHDWTMNEIQFSEKYTQVTFIPFRTGQSLILGPFSKEILEFMYTFVKKILVAEYTNICDVNGQDNESKPKRAKLRKRVVTFSESASSSSASSSSLVEAQIGSHMNLTDK